MDKRAKALQDLIETAGIDNIVKFIDLDEDELMEIEANGKKIMAKGEGALAVTFVPAQSYDGK